MRDRKRFKFNLKETIISEPKKIKKKDKEKNTGKLKIELIIALHEAPHDGITNMNGAFGNEYTYSHLG